VEQLSARAASTARQTLLFSATFPQPVHAAAQGLLRRPFLLRLGAAAASARGGGVEGGLEEEGEEGDEGEEGEEGAGCESWRELSIPAQVAQHVVVAAEHKKPRKLLRLLESLGHGASPAARAIASAAAAKPGKAAHVAKAAERRVLIFANKIKTAAFVAQLLAKHGVDAALLTSQLPQHAREAVLRRFAAAETPVLVATDVAARGLHIEGAPVSVKVPLALSQHQHPAGRHPTAPEACPACLGRLTPAPPTWAREAYPPLLKRGRGGALVGCPPSPIPPPYARVGLRHVVCWDFGTNLPQYVHRVGRTGRQGQPGNAHAFFTRNLAPLLPDLLELLKAHGQPIDPHLQQLVDAPAQPVGGGGGEARDGDEGRKRPRPGRGDELGEEESEDEEGAPQRWLVAKLVSPITGLAGTFRRDGLAGRKVAAARGGDGDDEERKRRKREKKRARKVTGE
jgi:superfamily II DNA/RNA helicase